MPASKAQQKAVNKYMAANYDRINLTVPKGKKESIRIYAESQGESVNGFINRAIDEAIDGTTSKPTASTQESANEILTRETLHKAQQAAELSGETVAAFVDRAVETQAQRDKIAQKMKPIESK